MTHDFNDAHQLKISKLQERLGNISSGLRKNLTTEIQNEKHVDISNIYSAITPSSIQRQQKQFHDEPEEKPLEKETVQQSKQQEKHTLLETTSIVETQQKSNDDSSSTNLKKQDLDQITIKQNVTHDNRSWQPWTYIPREKLRQLEKKTLSRLFKKY